MTKETSTGGSTSRRSRESSDDLLASILVSVTYSVALWYTTSFIMRQLEQWKQQGGGENATKNLDFIFRLGRSEAKDEEDDEDEEQAAIRIRRLQALRSVDSYESTVARDVIDPSKIETTFADVGGIDAIKTELYDLVVLPLIRPDLFESDSDLVKPPKGVLLYGAPGTGKTMLARAVAKESGAAFLNVRLSSIMNKWFGESNKLVAATFSLAQKLAPSVIFIDEIDTFLSRRDSSDGGGAISTMKSEFLTLWDGVLTDPSTPVMVLGATNRPNDVDPAILRRLPRSFEIGLPDVEGRNDILHKILKRQNMTEGARCMIPALAKSTSGYSGSDLKELCRAAAMEPIREVTRDFSKRKVSGFKGHMGKGQNEKVRAVSERDLAAALKKVKKTGESAREFSQREGDLRVPRVPSNDVEGVLKMLQMLMAVQSNANGDNDLDDHDLDDDSTIEKEFEDVADDIPEIK